jgi:hypothetical protein
MINSVKYMYLYTVIVLVRASARPGPLRPTGLTGRPGTIFPYACRVCTVLRHVGQPDPARSINGPCLTRPYSYQAKTDSGRVRAGWPVWTSIATASHGRGQQAVHVTPFPLEWHRIIASRRGWRGWWLEGRNTPRPARGAIFFFLAR